MTGAYRDFLNDSEITFTNILELGSRDGEDAIWLADRFQADVVCWECNPNALPTCVSRLRGREDITLVPLGAWSERKRLDFRPVVNGNIGASSFFHADTSYPYEPAYQQTTVIVPVMRIDEWYEDTGTPAPQLLCMDIQGAEMEALRGMGDMLHDVEVIITEGQEKRLYRDTPLIADIEEYLSQFGFTRVSEQMVNPWFGDFMFSRIQRPVED